MAAAAARVWWRGLVGAASVARGEQGTARAAAEARLTRRPLWSHPRLWPFISLRRDWATLSAVATGEEGERGG